MEYVHLPGISIPISRVVMGTDWLGARRFVYVRGRRFSSPFVDRKRHRANLDLLDGVAAAGCTAFDTARAYGDSERTLGEWLRSAAGLRERVALITKGGHPGPGWKSRLSSDAITYDLERSLKALGTEYIDLYLLHYDDQMSDVEPLVETLNRHLAAGRIRAIGVSNWTTGRNARAQRYAQSSRQQPFVVSSVQFSLPSWNAPPWQGAVTLSGEQSEADRRWYEANRLWLLAYSSLAMGFFSAARSYANGSPGAAAPRFGDQVFLNDVNLARLERTREMAQRLGVSAGQVALAWVLRYDPHVLPIVGARSIASYLDAVSACGLALSESERRWLSDGS